MQAKITIAMDNAAFEDDPLIELARILREAADKLESGNDGFQLRDINGNIVGELEVMD